MSEEATAEVEAEEPSVNTGIIEPEPEIVDEAATDDAVNDATEPPKKTRRDKRIDELTGKNYALENDRDYWRSQALENAKAKPEPEQVETPIEEPVRPKLADYDHDMERYAEALGQFTADSIAFAKESVATEIESNAKAANEKATAEEIHDQRQTKFLEAQTEFMAEHDDYEMIVGNPTLPISPMMTEAMLGLENGPAVAYHLGKHPEIAAKISKSTDPVDVGIQIGRIVSSLGKPKAPVSESSNAPEPPSTISGSQHAGEKDPAKMSDKEFAAMRRKQIASR